ncbi:MAG TPA: hypothetical protein VN702_17960 [Acetobacteraceae bacterium]|nr:hypothetical protein [Acetobacteraceae bacterium]
MDMSVHAAPAWPAAHAASPELPAENEQEPCIIAGLEPTGTVRRAFADRGIADSALSFQPDLRLPCGKTVLRLERDSGELLNRAGTLRAVWHRPPYAVRLRLVRYDAGSAVPLVLDEAVVGTRGAFTEFVQGTERVAVQLLADALCGSGRRFSDAESSYSALPPVSGMDGCFDHLRARWADRLRSEWWSLGFTSRSPREILRAGSLGTVQWLAPALGTAYCADPFPWPGTGKVLCEEMPLTGGHGRIVVLTERDGVFRHDGVVLEDGEHHSYPCIYRENNETFLLPETTSRGGTMLYRVSDGYSLTPICAVAEGRRLADPTLFRHEGRYWIACTDLDFGSHDNLVLLYADHLDGPWHSHPVAPARIDIRGARPAGSPFVVDGVLFRPAQDCAATYGGGIAINRIDVLTPQAFQESPVLRLLPDVGGPFPHGLHTFVSDGARTWIDGKRFVLDWPTLRQKLEARLRRRRSAGVSG